MLFWHQLCFRVPRYCCLYKCQQCRLSLSARQGYISTVFRSRLRSSFLSVGTEHIQGWSFSPYTFMWKFLNKLAQSCCCSAHREIFNFSFCCCYLPSRDHPIHVLYIMYEMQNNSSWWIVSLNAWKNRFRQNTIAVSLHFQTQGQCGSQVVTSQNVVLTAE